MRAAIIDLGTNTFHLLIVEVTGSRYRVIYKTKLPVKLGKGGMTNNRLQPDAMQRGMEALQQFNTQITTHACDEVHAFATSAIRSATNGNAFVAEVKRTTGIHIQVIDGDREAALIWRGVQLALPFRERMLIIDIGGGSTEFIIADDEQLYWKQSFPLGAARLLERCPPSDPITAAEITQLNALFKTELTPLFDAMQQWPTTTLCGCSGSFDTFVACIAHQFHGGQLPEGQAYQFDLDAYQTIHHQLVQSSLEERLAMPGVAAYRAEMIVMGTLLTHFVLQSFHIKNLYRSTFALKEGALNELM